MANGHSFHTLPTFGSPQWNTEVRRMVTAQAPLRFGVVGHDPQTKNSAILAWGFDYGQGEVVVESVRGDQRWQLSTAEDIRKYFPQAPEGGLELIWIDGQATVRTSRLG
ncbi:MAG TPA: hypothetical protein VE172_02190 [Stackebrandtia sp.]|jgi:hypothetical protein|nr:hypothetical protein [Stackebrandtia sp.]